MAKVGISFTIDSKILKQIHELMESEIIDSDGRIRHKVHEGVASQFYRELIREGYNLRLAKFDMEKEKYGIRNKDKREETE